ncbi:MAG TPA: YbfB/YjiJ family MFS transporter, partial [Stellaceae bacterium]|nr:YbfB/YjiJ family MFS transporter [Stellaceae bacterium]
MTATEWRAGLAAAAACLVGVGLARFAYTPLVPALINAHWLDAGEAGYLGAANFTGYLAGAFLARILAHRLAPSLLLRVMMLVTSIGFFACAIPLSFPWLALWRGLAGFSGAVLMVLAAPTVLPMITPARRGFIGGIIFTGVGLGIMISGLLVP